MIYKDYAWLCEQNEVFAWAWNAQEYSKQEGYNLKPIRVEKQSLLLAMTNKQYNQRDVMQAVFYKTIDRNK